MRRLGTPPPVSGKVPPGQSSSNGNGPTTRVSRVAPHSVPNTHNSNLSNKVVARTDSRINRPVTPIIMTKAQMRRRNALHINAINTVRKVVPVEADTSPATVTRNVTPSTMSSLSTVAPPIRAASKRRFLSVTGTLDSNTTPAVPLNQPDHITPSDVDPGPVRMIRTRVRARADPYDSQSIAPTSYSIQKYRRLHSRVSFALPGYDSKDSVTKVLTSEKILPRILSLMNWNELLPLRSVCRTWFETIESNPKVSKNFGIITLRSSIEPKMALYNASSVTWTKFRIIGPFVFDMTRSIQNEFWNKHGPLMTHLEISNRAMSLTGLVEILARCHKLEVFKCNWTPEMYSFNSELIRKYYGIHFNNGTFANLKNLTIECSSSLTDSALGSILKWCGGNLRCLSLTSPPDEDILTRLKPRWSVESIRNYFDRFGYTGNLQYLDFSWSNLTLLDVGSLCLMEMYLRGITLNYCKLDNESLRKILLKHGETLEVFKIEGVPFTESIFEKQILPKVKVLHIGGVKGMVHSLNFLNDMPCLEELSCHRTQWLEQNMILRPFNLKSKHNLMRCLDLGGSIKHAGNKNIDPNLNKTWFSDFTGLITSVRELNLSQWSVFGTNMNFQNICSTLHLLEKLIVRDWSQLNDVGTTGLFEEEVHQDWGTRLPVRSRVFLGQLQRLKVLDLGGTAITDATIFLALYPLCNLRSLAVDGTRVTDSGLRGLINKIPSLDRVSTSKCPRISITQPRLKRPDGRAVFLVKF